MTITSPQFTDPDRLSKLTSAFPEIERIFTRHREQKRLPGLAYGVVVDGQLMEARGLGVRHVEQGAPVTPDTVFRIASMTKSLTAMCILRLRDGGHLHLDEPVVDYVPELAALPYPAQDSPSISIRMLLSMSAGFPQDDPWADRQLDANEATLSDWLRGGISFSNVPGVTYEYSNLGFAILGRIVTNVAGQRYQDYATRCILEPLSMTSSGWELDEVPIDRLAQGYWLDKRADSWALDPMLHDGALASIGGLFTTINDWAKYMACLLSAFPARDDDDPTSPLRRSSLREMQQVWRFGGVSSHRLRPDSATRVTSSGYGFGLAIQTDSIVGLSVAHGGGLPGFGTYYQLLPGSAVGIVAFSNLRYGGLFDAVGEALAALSQTGGLTPRSLQVSRPLQALQSHVTSLYSGWDERRIASFVADNFFLDMSAEARQAALLSLRNDFGDVQSVSAIVAENALRGRWKMHCERGAIEVFASLSPTVPPRLQHVSFTPIMPPVPQLTLAVRRLLRLIAAWDVTGFRRVFGPSFSMHSVQARLEAARVQYGSLRLGDVLESGGQSTARFRLLGEKGQVDLSITINPKTGKLREFAFTRPRETTFM